MKKETRFYGLMACGGVLVVALTWGWGILYGKLVNWLDRLQGLPEEFDTPTDPFDHP